MPKIYSDEKKQEIKEKLLDVGFDLISKYGIKGMNVETLTKKVGIAQGTFYNFFKTKELLVYSLLERYQKKINKKVRDIIDNKGFLDKQDIKNIYHDMLLIDSDNLLRFIKREEVQTLITRLPKDLQIDFNKSKEVITSNFKYIRTGKNKSDIDSAAVFNWIQIMNLTLENRDILMEEAVEKNINMIIENMIDEIF